MHSIEAEGLNHHGRLRGVRQDNRLTANEEPTTPYVDTEPYYLTYWDVKQGNIGYYGHSGATVNYTSTFLVSQQSRYGIVILTNSSNDFYTPAITPDSIVQGVISILEGRSAPAVEKVRISQTGVILLALSFVLLLLLIIRIYRIRFFVSGIMYRKEKARCKAGIHGGNRLYSSGGCDNLFILGVFAAALILIAVFRFVRSSNAQKFV